MSPKRFPSTNVFGLRSQYGWEIGIWILHVLMLPSLKMIHRYTPSFRKMKGLA
jgi:hypothetical protein